jgi:putative hydrolase of the HAD superfamily
VKLKGIIFDLDDTLLKEVSSAEAAFVETLRLAEARHGVDPEAVHRVLRERAKPIWHGAPARGFCVRVGVSSWEALWAKFEGERPELAELREWIPTYRRQVWSTALEAFGIRDDDLVETLIETFPKNRRKRHILFDDTEATLKGLFGRYPLGLITNGLSCLQREKIDGAGIGHYFDAVAISGDLGIGKPDPRFFEHLLREMKLPPAETLMVGNSVWTDIKGAVAAGMPTLLVERRDPHTPNGEAAKPDAAIPDLTELEGALRAFERTP